MKEFGKGSERIFLETETTRGLDPRRGQSQSILSEGSLKHFLVSASLSSNKPVSSSHVNKALEHVAKTHINTESGRDPGSIPLLRVVRVSIRRLDLRVLYRKQLAVFFNPLAVV